MEIALDNKRSPSWVNRKGIYIPDLAPTDYNLFTEKAE